MTDDLIKRLEEAREPTRELDRAVAKTQGWHRVEPRFTRNKHGGWISPEDFIGAYSDGSPILDSLHGTTIYREVPAYTSSVDAALSLVPEGWKCGFENNNLHDEQPDHSEAWLWPSESNFEPDWQLGYDCMRAASPDTHGHAATPALAICIAALKAKLADPPTPRPEAGEGVE